MADTGSVSPVFAADRDLTLVAEYRTPRCWTNRLRRGPSEYTAIRTYLDKAGADVIAFQEVENLRAASRIFPASEYVVHVSERPARQFPECYDISNPRLMQRTGIAVRRDISARLGLRAVRQADVSELQGGHDAGRWGVYLILEHAVPDRAGSIPPHPPLHLLSLHLKSRCTYQALTGRKTRPDCAILHGQVNALSGWINSRNRLKQDFIIAGDFNRQLDQLSDEVWLRLESGGMPGTHADLEKVLHGTAHPQPYNPKFPYAIDHIIYNQALDALVVEEKTYFDTGAEKYSITCPFATFDCRHGEACPCAAGSSTLFQLITCSAGREAVERKAPGRQWRGSLPTRVNPRATASRPPRGATQQRHRRCSP